MRVIISIILMVIAALVGFFFGAGMNEAMGGAILLSMITGFACTINAIEKNKKDWQLSVYWEGAENEKSEVVVKEVYNGVLDFYVDYGFASSIYDDWFWKIFYEKGSKGNKFSIWISDFDVYEEQRHMGICS